MSSMLAVETMFSLTFGVVLAVVRKDESSRLTRVFVALTRLRHRTLINANTKQ